MTVLSLFQKSSSESRHANQFYPCLRTPLPSRIGIEHLVLHFTSVVCSLEIPGYDRAPCRVSLLHSHHHTPQFDSATRHLAVALLQVAGVDRRQGPRIEITTWGLFVLKYRRWRYATVFE